MTEEERIELSHAHSACGQRVGELLVMMLKRIEVLEKAMMLGRDDARTAGQIRPSTEP